MQRYSNLFGKTVKETLADMKAVSHRLLYKAGFVRESTAGRYYMLPLGMRVQDKIVAIVEDEMDKSGAQKLITPILHPVELWQETNRDNEAGFELMKVKDRREREFALGGTAEEMMVDLVRQYQLSYRDLPFNIYQFSPKFRDELRARGGLLRVREFLMKDAYSFHRDEEDFKKEYQKMWDAYGNMIKRLGMEYIVVEADNGYIGGEYCHEFVVDSEAGESRYLRTEDGKYAAHEDVAKFTHEAVNPDEEVKDFQIVDQPQWVRTMDENEKHYGKDKRHFLKNVVYTNFQGDVIIVTIRGDLEVNAVKLGHVLGETVALNSATEEDLTAIGTKTGYVHSWGHEFVKPIKALKEKRDRKVIYVADDSLKTVKNFIGGQKEDKTDSFNVNYGRDFKHDIEGDVAMAQAGFLAPNGKDRLIEGRGIEVGNIFQLGYHYSKKMRDALFIDNDGKAKEYYMGCYGFGIGRALATVVEVHHDDKGIIWPMNIAPYNIHVVTIDKKSELTNKSEEIIMMIEEAGFEVLWDDRVDAGAGQKLTDAELIGIPVRIVISDRSLEKGGIEVTDRKTGESEIVELGNIASYLNENYQLA
jgi:prolyl-tRNA synthetase